MKPSFDNV